MPVLSLAQDLKNKSVNNNVIPPLAFLSENLKCIQWIMVVVLFGFCGVR